MTGQVSWLTALLLAVVQGATEFIPVSSSGHMVLLSRLMGLPELPVSFAVAMHLGTLASVAVYLRREIGAMARSLLDAGATLEGGPGEVIRARSLWLPLIIGTVPAGLVGMLLLDHVEFLFKFPLGVGCFLVVTAVVLWVGDRLASAPRQEQLTWQRGLGVGLAQAASAVCRGLSRSGSTITAGMACGLSRDMAVKFSFLLSCLAIAGAGVAEAGELVKEPLAPGQATIYLVCAMVAALVGYLSLFLVRDATRTGSLFRRFGVYCLVVGVATVIASAIGYL